MTKNESRAKREEKGKDNENLQDMCKNSQGLQQKEEGILQNISYISSVGYSNYSWYLPDITRKT